MPFTTGHDGAALIAIILWEKMDILSVCVCKCYGTVVWHFYTFSGQHDIQHNGTQNKDTQHNYNHYWVP